MRNFTGEQATVSLPGLIRRPLVLLVGGALQRLMVATSNAGDCASRQGAVKTAATAQLFRYLCCKTSICCKSSRLIWRRQGIFCGGPCPAGGPGCGRRRPPHLNREIG